jgi:hypothetical protein
MGPGGGGFAGWAAIGGSEDGEALNGDSGGVSAGALDRPLPAGGAVGNGGAGSDILKLAGAGTAPSESA